MLKLAIANWVLWPNAVFSFYRVNFSFTCNKIDAI